MGTAATEHGSREARLRALGRLLDYLVEEVKDLDVPGMDKLLAAAVTAVNDEFDDGSTAESSE